MIQNHFDEEKKSFTKTLEKLVSLYTTYLVEESLCSRFWEDSGREKLPYSLREIEDDGRVPPRKKKRLTPKSFSHCSRIPWEYQRDRLPHHDDRYCLKSKGYVCVCGDDHDEAEGWWNGSWTDLTDFIKVWSVVVVYYNRESVVYNNYQCIENFFH